MSMVQAPETIKIRVVGPYDGPRISGTSERVDAVTVDRLYHIGADSICVRDIPAKRDATTGRLYVTASVAKKVQRKVREIGEAVERVRREAGGMPIHARLNLSISAAEFLPDAA